jgi:hypothetical protein
LEIQNIQVQRMLERIDRTRYKSSSVYDDNQNVHDVHIQKCVCDSIQNLLKDSSTPKLSDEDIINSDLNHRTKEALIEYCNETSVHSIHLITYRELLGYVWQRIQSSQHKNELLRILEEQIGDSICKCFTGRFNRTLAVLVGFFDDIQINISENSRISAIVLNRKEKCSNDGSPHDPKRCAELIEQDLLEAGYSKEEIQPWIDAILEEVEEEDENIIRD